MIANIETKNGWFIVKTPFRYDVKEAMKQIPGANWDKEDKAWTYPASPYVAESLAAVFKWKGVEVNGDKPYTIMSQTIKDEKEEEEVEPVKLTPGASGEIPHVTTKPFQHQRDAFWLMAKAFGDTIDG